MNEIKELLHFEFYIQEQIDFILGDELIDIISDIVFEKLMIGLIRPVVLSTANTFNATRDDAFDN